MELIYKLLISYISSLSSTVGMVCPPVMWRIDAPENIIPRQKLLLISNAATLLSELL